MRSPSKDTSYVATSSCHVPGVLDRGPLQPEEPAGDVEQPLADGSKGK